MLMIEPWFAKMNEKTELSALRGKIIGEILRAVHYMVPRGEGWPEGHTSDKAAHEVDMAVELVMESGAPATLAWAIGGLNEGLRVVVCGRTAKPRTEDHHNAC